MNSEFPKFTVARAEFSKNVLDTPLEYLSIPKSYKLAPRSKSHSDKNEGTKLFSNTRRIEQIFVAS